jgi:hypothetical protein
MEPGEINTPSSTEASLYDTGELMAPDHRARLRKLGNKALNVLNVVTPTAAIYGIVDTYDHSFPPQYSLGGSLIAGTILTVGNAKFSQMRVKRKAKKNPPKGPDITESGSLVV